MWPSSYYYALEIAIRTEIMRHSGITGFLASDGKLSVTRQIQVMSDCLTSLLAEGDVDSFANKISP